MCPSSAWSFGGGWLLGWFASLARKKMEYIKELSLGNIKTAGLDSFIFTSKIKKSCNLNKGNERRRTGFR